MFSVLIVVVNVSVEASYGKMNEIEQVAAKVKQGRIQWSISHGQVSRSGIPQKNF